MRNSIRKEKRRVHPLIVTLLIMLCLIGAVYAVLNMVIIPKSYLIEDERIPKSFVGYKIMYINNLANNKLDIIGKIAKYEPDLVIFNGEFKDENGDVSNSIQVMKDASTRCRVMYVSDNDKLEDSIDDSNIEEVSGRAIKIQAPKIDTDEFISRYIEKKYRDKENSDEKVKEYLEYTRKELERTANYEIEICGFQELFNDAEAGRYIADDIGKVANLGSSDFKIGIVGKCSRVKDIRDIGVAFIGKDESANHINEIESYNSVVDIVSGGINPEGLGFKKIIIVTLTDGTINNDNPLEKLMGWFISDVGTRFDNDKGFSKDTKYYD